MSKQSSSKKYIEHSQRKNKSKVRSGKHHEVPTIETIFKLIKKVKLAKHLSPNKCAVVLYLVTEIQESTFLIRMGDLSDKGLDQFLTYMRSKADEVLNNLMKRYKFSLEE